MERKIGEVFTYEGKTYKVLVSDTCKGCVFNSKDSCEANKRVTGLCCSIYRKNNIGVIFKELKNMEININIPKGMEIDVENSDLKAGIIMFKKKLINYNDVWSAIAAKGGYSEVELFEKNQNKLATINKLMNIASYYNGDWKPEWSNSKENKYCIKFDYHKDRFYVDYNNSIGAGDVFFKNSEDARAVINNPNFKSILNTIYKN